MLFLPKCAIIINNAVKCWIGLGSMAAIDRMLCQAAEHFLYIGTEEIFMSVSYKKLWKLLIDNDMNKKEL